MSGQSKTMSHPYQAYEDSPAWSVVDRAIRELAENRDLEETTSHSYIVGYVCKAIYEGVVMEPKMKQRSQEEIELRVRQAQELMRPFRVAGRSLVDELIAERRAETDGD